MLPFRFYYIIASYYQKTKIDLIISAISNYLRLTIYFHLSDRELGCHLSPKLVCFDELGSISTYISSHFYYYLLTTDILDIVRTTYYREILLLTSCFLFFSSYTQTLTPTLYNLQLYTLYNIQCMYNVYCIISILYYIYINYTIYILYNILYKVNANSTRLSKAIIKI